MENKLPYNHRDISWLSFNYRVLQEAKDPSLPLMERIKFFAIYSSNLNEYFRVRVAQVRNLVRVGKKTKKKLDFDPKQILKKIHKIVNKQQEEFSEIFEQQIIPELKNNNIHLLKIKELNQEQKEFIETYFHNELLPYVQPVLLVKKKIRPFLNNAALYLAVLLQEKYKEKDGEQYAIIKVPSEHLPRFIALPSPEGAHHLMILDDIVRQSISWLFPGYDIIDTYSIKLTRDAELYIEDEFTGDLVQKIKKSLIKRNVGPASRMVYDRKMPEQLLEFLMETFDLEKLDLLPEGEYHNNFDFFGFPNSVGEKLERSPMPPLPYKPLEEAEDYFSTIAQKDHFIHVPYQSYKSVIRFFEEAAMDPYVTHIKIVQYRVAKKSRIMDALIRAVKNGKLVTAFIEVKARFDEEANLKWGEKLEKAGVKVHYSFPGLKVHAKLAIVERELKGEMKRYCYLSTGNFHEDTAKVYSDVGLFTFDKRITEEAVRVFTFLETVRVPQTPFKHLLVGQFNLRNDLIAYVDQEIENAKAGKAAKIILKMNSLEDKMMISKLYEASQAGVEIKMIIRGICSLIPGLKGFSENIEVRSIVDQYLEHARIFIFHNDGNERYYISSADWMVRNLSYRIETAVPIYDYAIQKEIKDFLTMQWQDNTKARIINNTQNNEFYQGNPEKKVRAQMATYAYYKSRE